MNSIYILLLLLQPTELQGMTLSRFKLAVARSYDPSRDLYKNWPSYEQLPLHSSFPTKAAWGVWGTNDELGALNHITHETIRYATSEIKEGIAIPINLELSVPDPPPNPERRPMTHLFQPGVGYIDDVLVMNTQTSTQFDGLRHFPYSTNNSIDTYQWYNDLIDSLDDVIGPNPTTVLGLQVSAQKGIAVRAVLLDWAAWKEACGENPDPFSTIDITADDLDKVAAWQGLKAKWSRPADMLIIRTGWVSKYKTLNATERTMLPLGNGFSAGMVASDDSAKWLWNKKLSLVGGDNPAFESVSFLPAGIQITYFMR
jgi:hypothetical protein